MSNNFITIKVMVKIAKALKELRTQMIFVGGAVVGLYADDPAEEEIRPTKDIDLTIQLTGNAAWVQLQERLVELGFTPDPQGHSISSYVYKDIPEDILLSEDGPLGKTNKWFKPGFENVVEIDLKQETIRILSAPYFLAAKFEAFNNRGGDYRISHDIEDIIYVLNNKINIAEEIKNADKIVN